jgi:hypothetical protein
MQLQQPSVATYWLNLHWASWFNPDTLWGQPVRYHHPAGTKQTDFNKWYCYHPINILLLLAWMNGIHFDCWMILGLCGFTLDVHSVHFLTQKEDGVM